MNRVRPRIVLQLASFGLNGLATAAVFSAVVWTLIALSHDTFALDVVLAYLASVVANYLGSRLIFHQPGTPPGHLVRYLAVVAANLAVTAVSAWLLHRSNVTDVLAAYLPPAITAVPTFVVMRRWVFAVSSQPSAAGTADRSTRPA